MREHGRRAGAYHAGLRRRERDEVHEGFMSGALDVGVDKPDVRFVLHAASPASLDAYDRTLSLAAVREHGLLDTPA